jgi:serine/threonine protein kinase
MLSISTLCPGCFTQQGNETLCPRCENKQQFSYALKRGTLLQNKFRVGRILGEPGGFGITYLVWNDELQRREAIKEFFPSALVARSPNGKNIVLQKPEFREDFRHHLTKFLDEARNLAQFSHPNVIEIFHYFEENNTAYFTMPYHKGISLAEYLKSKEKKGSRISEAQVISIALEILDGLKQVHKIGILHRDIKPQNIYLPRDKRNRRAILLDFGSARLEKLDQKTAIVTPGFAPPEQTHPDGEQGPWTDIYSLAVTIFCVLVGKRPPAPFKKSDLEFSATTSPKTDLISAGLYKMLVQAMQENPEDRPQNVEEFQALLKKALQSNSKGRPSNLEEFQTLPGKAIQKLTTKIYPPTGNKARFYLVLIGLCIVVLVIILAIKNDQRSHSEIGTVKPFVAVPRLTIVKIPEYSKYKVRLISLVLSDSTRKKIEGRLKEFGFKIERRWRTEPPTHAIVYHANSAKDVADDITKSLNDEFGILLYEPKFVRSPFKDAIDFELTINVKSTK